LLPYANLIEALEAAPADRPFLTYWVDEDEHETVSFGEFRRRASAEALALRTEGLGNGDRVVLIVPQGIAAMTAFVGAMMLGAVPAFLAYPNFKVDPAKYRSGLAGVTANLSARAVVIDRDFPPEMMACVSFASETKLLRTGSRESRSDDRATGLPEVSPIQPDSLAFIQHSAGTTGLQKGVALTHAAVLRQLGYLAHALKINSGDRIYSWLPLYHDMGLIACFMLPIACHLPVVMHSPMDWVMQPESMPQLVSQFHCTLGWMPNFAFQFVAKRTPQNRRADYDLSSLRVLINCSEPVHARSMRQFQNAFGIRDGVLQSSYAMAENVFAVTQSDITRSGPSVIWVDGPQFRRAHRVVPVAEGTSGAMSFTSSGRLLANQQVRIVSDSGNAADFVGEIQIKTDCLFEEYFNRPDLTRESLADGWYRTGDLGFLVDGELYVVGRQKDLLIIGGENIYPQDIEEIVSAHPAIHDGRAIAIGIYNPALGTEDVVVVAEVESEGMLADALRLEQEIRSRVVAGLGIAVRTIFLKPPKWIVKSTAGKAARSSTREKLLREHPELNADACVAGTGPEDLT